MREGIPGVGRVYLPGHMPPSHPDIILSGQFPPFCPGWTDLTMLTVLVNGAVLRRVVCRVTRLKKGEPSGWVASQSLRVLKGVMVGRRSMRRSFRVYQEN